MPSYVPAYIWLSESTDSASGGEGVLRERTPLGRAARETLAKLKKRTPAHIREVRDYWYELEECKHKSVPKEYNANEMFRNIGILITMPDRLAEEILDRVDGKGNKTKQLRSDVAKMMVEKLSMRPQKYMDQVGRFWFILKLKRSGDEQEKIRMFKDIGLLLQITDQEVHEMIWRSLEMIESGEIAENEAQRSQGTAPSVTPRADKYPKGICPRHRHPKPLEKISLEHTSSDRAGEKRSAEDGDDDDQPARKQARGEAERYIPTTGEWKCAICKFWTSMTESVCMRKDSEGRRVCRGRSGTHTSRVAY